MEVSKQLIESFFKHECSPSEADAVKQYLEQNPELLITYLPKGEWEQSSATADLPNTYWQQQWNQIERKRKGNVVSINLRKWAVAAAVLIIIAGVSYFYFSKPALEKPVAEIKVQKEKSVLNTTDKEMAILLPDGSQVMLAKGATINYKENFEADKRDIVLTGTAVFEVAKDKSRPFTVYSGDITTTALGTKFKVTYPGKNSHATVHLYEGKVVVKAVSSKNIQPSYLVAGDVLKYENEQFFIAHSINKNEYKNQQLNTTHEKELSVADKLTATKKTGQAGNAAAIAIPQWYKFEKESLKNVLDQLASLYNVTIEYDKADLMNKYFIGRFEQHQPIEKILKTIITLNDLQLEKTDDSHYKIKK